LSMLFGFFLVSERSILFVFSSSLVNDSSKEKDQHCACLNWNPFDQAS
jgi:hypothetical protein